MIRTISIFTALSSIALVATPAQADDGYINANTHVLVGDEKVVTAEYSWASGPLSGFGFVDKSLNSDFVISDHEVRGNVAGPVYVSVEVGYNKFGGEMGKIGAGVNLGGLPAIQDNFVFLNVYAQKPVFGPSFNHLVGVSWGTKDLRVAEGVSVYASGFADIKSGAPDVVQPQAWLKFDDSPIEVGTEVSFFGKETSFSGAVKFKF